MNFLFRPGALLMLLLLAGCFDPEDPPNHAPENISVTLGESLVVLNWDVEPGLTYWVFYNQGTTTGLGTSEKILTNISPPLVIPNLVNGTKYAFAMAASQAGSRIGPVSATLTAIPRLLGPGIEWFNETISSKNLNSIASGNNTYVAVGDNARIFVGAFNYTSNNGVTAWNQPTSPPLTATTDLTSVIYNGIGFVGLGHDGSIIKSVDSGSLTWETAKGISGAPTMNAIAIGGNNYVAVGNSGAIYTNDSLDITDDWKARTSGITDDLMGVSFVNNTYVAVGAAGAILTSSDGYTWKSPTPVPLTPNTLHKVAFGADLFVVVGDSGTIISSSDAKSWKLQTMPTTDSLRSITFGPDQQFIAVGTSGRLAFSVTGKDGSWGIYNAGAIDLNSIAPGQVFIAVGDGGTVVSGK